MASSPSIVITGAAGFIGSRLLESLASRHKPEQLLAVDHAMVPAKQLNLEVAPQVEFQNHEQFINALESGKISPELILHMGACSATTEANWDYLKENNLVYSQRLWTWCAQNNARLIYASSAATYGDGSAGFDDEEDITRLRPLNLYGKSKQDFDLWVKTQIEEGKPQPAQSVGLKFFNVFGPGEAHKGRMASMVFHGYFQILKTGSVRLFKSHHPDYADGGQLRDFIYVKDVVRIIEQLAAHPEVSGLFNVGTGHAQSFRELIEAIFTALNQPPSIEYIPMPDDLRDKYQYFTEAKMLKLAKAGINYNPTLLIEAVKDYCHWLEMGSTRASRVVFGVSPNT